MKNILTAHENQGRFWVKVARPVMQLAVLEVDAADHEKAAQIAQEQANTLPVDAWISTYTSDDYSCHVQEVRDGPWPEVAYSQGRAGIPDDEVRYLTLAAWVEKETGTSPTDNAQLCRQRWLEQCSDHMIVGFCLRWIALLAQLAGEASDRIHDASLEEQEAHDGEAKEGAEESLAALLALEAAGVLKRQDTPAARAAVGRARVVLEGLGVRRKGRRQRTNDLPK